MQNSQFVAADYAVFGLTIGISMTIGIVVSFKGSKDNNPNEYLVGNRRLAVLPVAISMLMSGVSASQLLGTTAEMYFFGTQNFMETMGRLLVYLLPILLIVPIIHPLKLTSIFQYFKLRFDSDLLHRFNVLMFTLGQILSNGIQLFGPATAFEAVTGINYMYCIGATGLIVTVYSAIGGIKSVVWTDVFQGLVLIIGLLIMLGVGASKVGGLSRVWEISDEGERIKFFDMNPDPTERMTFWTAVTGGASTTIMAGALGQTAVQRYSSVSTKKKGMCLFAVSIPTSILIEVLISLTGLTIYAYYVDCDPMLGGHIGNPNQVLPYFMVNVLDTPGLPGLFLSVLFCACLSTSSTMLNGTSAILYKGYFEPLLNWMGISEYRKLIFLRIQVCLLGGLATAAAFGIPHLDGHVIQLSATLLGGIGAPLASCVFLGMLVPFVQWKGALAGTCAGMFFTSWIAIAKQLGDDITPHILPLTYNETICDPASSESGGLTTLAGFTTWTDQMTTVGSEQGDGEMFVLYRVSFMYLTSIAFLITFVTGIIASLLTGPEKPGRVDPRTMANWSDTIFFRYMSPERRHKLMCGYDKLEEDWEMINGKNVDSEVSDEKKLEVKDPPDVSVDQKKWLDLGSTNFGAELQSKYDYSTRL